MDPTTFRRDFLNVMHGIAREDHRNRLTKAGRELLDILRNPLVKALTRLETYSPVEIEELYRDLKLERI